MASMRKNRIYKKSLLIYTIILFVLFLAFSVYIYMTLVDYEKYQATTFIKTTVKNLSDDTLKEYLKSNNQDESLLNEYRNIINDKDVVIIKKDDNLFEVSLNDRVLFEIETKTLKTGTKLGMFSYEVREVSKITPNLERGLVYYDIIVPSNYTVLIDKEIAKYTKKEEYKNLDFMYVNESMPYMVTYEINDLSKEAEIEVTDEYGKKVELVKKKYVYNLEKNYLSFDSYDEAKKYLSTEVDIWDYAHNWSLYLSRDLKGTLYGYDKIKSYYIEGSLLDKKAYNWPHSIDITFVSSHILLDPTFTNEKLSNFTIYSKDAFSCEVYLVKRMKVDGKQVDDIMNDYIYFVKDNGIWKVVNQKAASKDE